MNRGDIVKQHIVIVDGNGAVASISGAAGYTLKVGVGVAGETFLTQQTSWATVTTGGGLAGWAGTLDLSVAAITTAISNNPTLHVLWELEITETATSNVRTYAQQEITILNKVN